MSHDHHTKDELERMWAPEPECCVGVECSPAKIDIVVLQTVKHGLCRCGHHRIVETRGRRTVEHRSTRELVWPWIP